LIKFILEYLFIFITGALIGWGLEVVYRRYFGKAKKWLNPGFLNGPYLPIYGTGVCLLYIVSDLEVSLALKIAFFAAVTTGIEYITGLFFLKYYKTRLWDYTKVRFNIRGIIAPKYSFYWTLLSLIFYYVLYPYFYKQIEYLYANLQFSLFVGVFYGILIVDLVHSFNVMNRLKALADSLTESLEESKVIIRYEQLKLDIREKVEDITENIGDHLDDISQLREKYTIKKIKPSYLFPFKGDFNMKKQLKYHFEKRSKE